ncbi:hypothetical protein J6590_006009 [Homalodisca vitripennis]|nr:hypothetical protein J6590_006009 [Homalodisca vitripennis]
MEIARRAITGCREIWQGVLSLVQSSNIYNLRGETTQYSVYLGSSTMLFKIILAVLLTLAVCEVEVVQGDYYPYPDPPTTTKAPPPPPYKAYAAPATTAATTKAPTTHKMYYG